MLYITLRQYEYIEAVADAGSLTNAADRLNVSQPSLSVAITRVEQRLGKAIFIRKKGAAIQITPFGHQVIAEARKLLKQAARLELKAHTEAAFNLTCFEDIAPWYLAPALDRLESEFPTMTFRAREGRFNDLANDLSQGRSDIAISYDVGFKEDFDKRVIRQVAPAAFLPANHPLAQRSSVELSELISDPMILFNENQSERFIRQLFADLHLTPTVRQRVTSLEMMRSLVAHGFGVGISYSYPTNDQSYDGNPLGTVPISTPQATADIVLLWSRLRDMDPFFHKVIECLS